VSGAPDVDAIYRLTRHSDESAWHLVLDAPELLMLDRGVFSPFNSQNTLFFHRTFPLLYLPSTVSSRYADILRAVVAQPSLWMMGLRLVFCSPTAIQRRNYHDLMQDFREEIDMYKSVDRAAELAEQFSTFPSPITNLHAVYGALAREGIVESEEVERLGAWAEALEQIQGNLIVSQLSH
jgi:hypothetical protein